MKIIRHAKPYHIDDVLAVSLLLKKYPEAEVVEAKNNEEALTIRDEGDVLVDVGGIYGRKMYDHHQDKTLPASFVLVLQSEYGYDIDELPETLQYYSLLDTQGFVQAAKFIGGRQVRPLLDSWITSINLPKEMMLSLADYILHMCEVVKRTREIIADSIISNNKIISVKQAVDITTLGELLPRMKVVVHPNRDPELMSITRITRFSEEGTLPLELKSISKYFTGFSCGVPREKVEDAIDILIEKL